MNRQKMATVSSIILSIVFSLSIGLFVHFKVFLPYVSDVYEKALYYPEALYEEYQKEAEEMIDRHEYTCKYPVQTKSYFEDGRQTLILKIGEYNEGKGWSAYITVTVKNFGTNEQEVIFERRIKNAEEAYKRAQNYRNLMHIYTAVFVIILVIFTVYLIINSIKRRYMKVFASSLLFALIMAMIIWLVLEYRF